ncbi:MAG: hypothetical protein KAS77_05555 [Thermoplasmata archaeon]|nr:hypothetical protein [Thermoplasmata archaeon]
MFPRWYKRETGLIPVAERTFVNISHMAKASLTRLTISGYIERVNHSTSIGELSTFRTTDAGKEALKDRIAEVEGAKIESLTRCNRCDAPLSLRVMMDEVVEDHLGSHVRATLDCSNDACEEREEVDFIHILKLEQSELLYIMSQFTHEGDFWITHNALRILVFEGIMYKEEGGRDVFEGWDYAPASVRFREGRRYINLSQEAEDDLNDLREMGLIEELRVGGPRSEYMTKYQIGLEGRMMIDYLPEHLKNAIDGFLICPKCKADMISIFCGLDRIGAEHECLVRCRSETCDYQKPSEIMRIKNVSYVSIPYWYGCLNPTPSRGGCDPGDLRGPSGM